MLQLAAKAAGFGKFRFDFPVILHSDPPPVFQRLATAIR